MRSTTCHGTRATETGTRRPCRGDAAGTAVIQAPFTLGGDENQFAWHGQIDDVRIYDRALGADEVRQIYDCR